LYDSDALRDLAEDFRNQQRNLDKCLQKSKIVLIFAA